MGKEYTLELTDPRVYKRAKRAYGFTRACITTSILGKETSKTWIDKHFSDTSKPLGRHLKEMLLIETDSFFNPLAKKCKKWRQNDRGMSMLREQLKVAQNAGEETTEAFDKGIVEEMIEENYGDDLRSGNIEYKESSYRLFHGFQNTKREFKQDLLAKYGYYHHYDIDCAAPTIIYQQAQLCGMTDPVLSLRDYTQNKSTIRQTFANELNIPLKVVKTIFTAITNGADLRKGKSVYHLIDNDETFLQFRSDRFVKEYIRDLKICWKHINPNKEPKQWTNTYYRIERMCLDIAKAYCERHNIKVYLEHDGFSTSDPVNVSLIKRMIKRDTKLDLSFSYQTCAFLDRPITYKVYNGPERTGHNQTITLKDGNNKVLRNLNNNLTMENNK